MLNAEFLDLAEAKAAEGQHQLADVIRKLLYRTAPDLFGLLDFQDDRPFLEPLLFAYFNAAKPDASLAQILFGYVREGLKPETITVLTDEHGTAYLPRVGYCVTRMPSSHVQLHWRRGTKVPQLTACDETLSFDFQPCVWLKNTTIEICQHMPPLLKHVFRNPQGELVDVEVASTTREHAENLSNAARLIEVCYPTYFENLARVTRKVLIYKGQHPSSFATIRAHGVAFLNATNAIDDVFFLEDMIHQCGHILFTAITSEPTDYLAVDPDTPMSEVAPVDSLNSLYSAFQGLFTQANINYCLHTCYQQRVFSGRKEHELIGRFSDDMKRFATALERLGRRELYTDRGWFFYNTFREVFVDLYRVNHGLINAFDTSNQPYVFNYDAFLEANPT